MADYDELTLNLAEARFGSGLERLMDDLKPKALSRPVRTIITLPADQIEDGLEHRLRAALKRYCEHKIGQNRRELRSLREGTEGAAERPHLPGDLRAVVHCFRGRGVPA